MGKRACSDRRDELSPLTPRDAAIQILEQVRPQPLRVPLDDALDGVLAEDIISPLNLPAWDNSAMDGYAVRSLDTRDATPEAPARLRVVEQIPAGHFPTNSIEAGTSARIFTGAPVPRGADAVVRQEDTDQGSDNVAIGRPAEAGQNIRRAGEDIARGSTVLLAGTEIGPAHLGVLASLAVSNPMIYRRPRVAILSRGDEIADIDQPDEILSGRKIASSNGPHPCGTGPPSGGEPVNLGIARDTPESLREHLVRGFDCDHHHDRRHQRRARLHQASAGRTGRQLRFWRLRMRPGAPVGFGMIGNIPWLGFAGQSGEHDGDLRGSLVARPSRNSAAAVDPSGRPLESLWRSRSYSLPAAALSAGRPDERQEWLRSKAHRTSGSGILTSMMRADALLIVPEGQFETPSGATAQALVTARRTRNSRPSKLFRRQCSGTGRTHRSRLSGAELRRHRGGAGGVAFQGDWETMARAISGSAPPAGCCFASGPFTPERLVNWNGEPLLLPWDKYLTPGRPVHLRVTSRKSRLYHQGAIAERIGNGIREVTGTSPESASGNEETSVDEQVVVVRVLRDECLVSLDSSGELLHRRGYRLASAKAPLRETLGAALLMASEWDGVHPLIDPFSGAPTQTAAAARKIPPGLNRQFGFSIGAATSGRSGRSLSSLLVGESWCRPRNNSGIRS